MYNHLMLTGRLANRRLFTNLTNYKYMSQMAAVQSDDNEPPRPKGWYTISNYWLDAMPYPDYMLGQFKMTKEAREFLRPELRNANQTEIMSVHEGRTTSHTNYWRGLFIETDPKLYWVYGVTNVLRDYKELSGPFSTRLYPVLMVLTLASMEWLTYWNVYESIAYIFLFMELARRFIPSVLGEVVRKDRNHFANRVPLLWGERIEAYKNIKEKMDKERDYGYVQLMLSDYQNEMAEIKKETQYRTFLKQKHDSFKRCLDCQVELTNAQTNFESNLLKSWILPQVDSEVGKKAVKDDFLAKCVNLLKSKGASGATVI